MCYTLIWVAPQKFIIAFVPLREVEGRKLFLLSQNKNKEDNMKTQSFNEIENLTKEYSMIPICKEIYADVITPIQLLRKMEAFDKNFFLLESVEGGEKWARYSFLGYEPVLHITCKNGKVTQKSGEIEHTVTVDPMDALRQLLHKYKSPKIEGMPTFTGGFVGYFGYEMIGYAEPKLNIKDSEFDDYNLMLFDKVIVYDHLKQKIMVIANMKSKDGIQGYNTALLEIEKMIALINDQRKLPVLEADKDVKFKCNVTKEEYCRMIEKTKHYIKEGDIFQGVISRRFVADYKSSLINAYRVLRTTNPSPYMYFIQSDDLLMAKMNAQLIIQVIINIIDNAIKYTPPGSTITISSKRDKDMVVVAIADNGPGVTDEEKDRLFDMFYSGNNTVADSRRGMGLGLALCKSIITAHKGTITVRDNVPHGTIFSFTLPAEEVKLHE